MKKYLPYVVGVAALALLVILILPKKQTLGGIDPASIDDITALAWAKEQVAAKQQAVIDQAKYEADSAKAQADAKDALVVKVKADGYKGDGSKADFEILIKKFPGYLGAYSVDKLNYYSAGGLYSFLQMWQMYK